MDGVKDIIEQAGATVLYWPPYSPDLNSIEMMWSKIKTFLRIRKAKSLEALLAAIPDAFFPFLFPMSLVGFLMRAIQLNSRCCYNSTLPELNHDTFFL